MSDDFPIISPKMLDALKRASLSLFNPSPEAAAWMDANRPNEEEIMRELKEHYLREMPTKGVH